MTNDITTGVEMPEAVDLANPNDEKACYGHTADQLQAFGAACRLKALSEALEIADHCADADMHSSMAANAIRALKGEA